MEKKAGKSSSDIMGDKMAERALRASHRFIEIANRHSRMDSLLGELVAEGGTYSHQGGRPYRRVDLYR